MNAGNKKVFVAMSGGVDSSVAALLLKKRGYDVVGVFMRSYNLDGCAERDARDARLAAEKIGMPFYVWDFEEEYKNKVVDYMVEGYRRGITPNPDVMCNKEIKFGLFLARALKLGADFIATGHYAKIKPGKVARLFMAGDPNKDQSYFLWTLAQEQLKYCFFPIGGYLKSEVRGIARRAGLPTADKKDSQGICFLGKVTLADFLKKRIPEKRGAVLTSAGKPIGEHRGSYFYTIGQRHIDADLQFPKTNLPKNRMPLYVAGKDIRNNVLIVAEGSDNPALYKTEIKLADINFINPACRSLIRANKQIRVMARVRYRQPPSWANLAAGGPLRSSSCGAGKEQTTGNLVFAKPQKFVAPGQSAVFYSKKGELLGGGVIV